MARSRRRNWNWDVCCCVSYFCFQLCVQLNCQCRLSEWKTERKRFALDTNGGRNLWLTAQFIASQTSVEIVRMETHSFIAKPIHTWAMARLIEVAEMWCGSHQLKERKYTLTISFFSFFFCYSLFCNNRYCFGIEIILIHIMMFSQFCFSFFKIKKKKKKESQKVVLMLTNITFRFSMDRASAMREEMRNELVLR